MKLIKWIYRHWLKILSPIVATIFLSATLMGCMPAGCTKKPLPDPKLLQKRLLKTSNAEKLTKKIEKLSSLLQSLDKALASNKEVDNELKEIKGIKADLARLNKAIKKDFAKTREVLENIDSKEKVKVEAKVEKEYSKKYKELTKQLSAIVSEKDQTNLKTQVAALQAWINKVTPEPVHQPLGTDLPHRVVDYNAGPPTLGTGIAPAYAPNLPNVEPSKLPKTPTDDDLAETIEVQFTQDITTLTAQLEHNPIKMYEWVKNNIVYEPYYGSRKGANETLWEKGGNDFDQASLSIALFRNSGIPARYVYGVVEIPIDKAMNWVGVEKPEVAAKVFSAGGIPSQAVISGGQITAIRLEHVWVEVYVNYENYRGLDLGGGGQKEWIPLDPSFKQYSYKEPIDVKSAAGINPDELITTDTAVIEQKFNTYVENLTAYIDQNLQGKKLGDIIGEKKIIPENLGLLPPTLQVKTVSIKSEYSNLPGSLLYKIKISLSDEPEGNYDVSLAEVAGKRITLYYSPSSESDVDLIKSYGSIYLVPAYLVKMRAVLLVDGELQAIGQPLNLGTSELISVTFTHPSGLSEIIEKEITAGAYYALGLNLGKINGKTLNFERQELADTLKKCETEYVDSDEIIGQLFSVHALTYFALQEIMTDLAVNLGNVVVTREPSIGFPALATSTSYVFGTPYQLSSKGFNFDLKRNVFNCQAKDGDNQKRLSWALTSGMLSSGAEDVLYETLYKIPSVSTQKILLEASKQGIPLHVVTKDNINSELPLLQIDQSIKEEIRNSVNQGRIVTIPERNITHYQWMGVGWIDMDPDTGDAAYQISSGISGVFTSALEEWVNKGLRDLCDITASWGLSIIKPVSFTRYGKPVDAYKVLIKSQFVSPLVKTALEIISYVALPVVNALAQISEDLHNTNLEAWQKFERALLAFIAGIVACFAVDAVLYVVGLLTANPAILLCASIITVAALDILWEVFKNQIFEIFQSGSSSSSKYEPKAWFYAQDLIGEMIYG